MPVQFKFFYIPLGDPAAATAALNEFVDKHQVLTVERAFVAQGSSSAWSVCVQYQTVGATKDSTITNGTPRTTKKPRIDYREILTKVQFHVFALLRDCRADLARRDGVPTYVVATNDQLAEMVRTKVNSKAKLEAIDGIGKSRAANYGAPMLVILREHHQALTNDPDDAPAKPAAAADTPDAPTAPAQVS